MHNNLNPKIFNEYDHMIPEVRESLLEVSEEFSKTVCENSGICLEPVDIVLVGSNASYNYTDSLDIDLHLVFNFDMIDGSPDSLIQSYYNAEKTNFNSNYNFRIKGLEVEVYVEDINSSAISNGIYSVLRDLWIKAPEKVDNTGSYNVEVFDDFFNAVVSALSSEDLERVKSIINDLYLLRKDSLSVSGELGSGNLIFKEIRSLGLLDELKDKYFELVSKTISVESYLTEDRFKNRDYVADYSQVPKYLYHATLYNNLDSIQKYGLGFNINKDSSFYDPLYQGHGIFLSYDPKDAEMYLSNYSPEDVVVLQIPKSILDKDLIYYDTNNEDNIKSPTSWYYKGVIKDPISKVKIVDF